MRTPVRYIRWKGQNFGDDLNDTLFQDVFGVNEWTENVNAISDGVNLLGIGTLLNGNLNLSDPASLWIIGSGAGNNLGMPRFSSNTNLFFVRGPLTCQYLNLPSDRAMGDAAYLLADKFLAVASKSVVQPRRVGIIPHHWSIESNYPRWQQILQHPSIISPQLEWTAFVEQVNACEVILTECLHGAILADILHKPFIVFATTPAFHTFKWLDWASSRNLQLKINAFDFDDPESLARTEMPILSKQETLNTVLEKLEPAKVEIRRQLEIIAAKGADR